MEHCRLAVLQHGYFHNSRSVREVDKVHAVSSSNLFLLFPLALLYVVSLLSLTGYGDLSPSTVGGQIFTIFFAIYGITILGAFLGLAGQVIIERNNVAIELARKEVQASILKTFATSGNDDDSDEASTHDTLNEDKSLMKEIFDLLVSGIPVVALLLGLAITIARAESWNFMTG